MTGRVIVHGVVDVEASVSVVAALGRSAELGLETLVTEGSAVGAVEAALRSLEADPAFNAGYGSVLNGDGVVELDAGVVDGKAGRFAGVAAVRGIRHPVSLAVELLRRADGPVLLAGEGAARFARAVGFAEEDLRSPEQHRAWRGGGTDAGVSAFTGRPRVGSDTVGCIAVGDDGQLAAGSSTGGILKKLPGRVGDAPILGAGLYADEGVAAVCSGQGERTIEMLLGYRACAELRVSGDAQGAAVWSIELLQAERGAQGGIVLYDLATDQIGAAHNTSTFPVVTVARGEEPRIFESVRVAERESLRG